MAAEGERATMRKASSLSQLSTMIRTPSGGIISSFHSRQTWEEHGGWQPSDPADRRRHRMERDASMVNFLNAVNPNLLADEQSSKPGDDEKSPARSPKAEQHSALSKRGVVHVGALSACAWYGLRLFLRDVLGLSAGVAELTMLRTFHSLGWAAFLAQKVGVSQVEMPKFCTRALLASLGFYIHDCWALRGTLLSNPLMLLHQASMVTTISAILRSKGVAWLAIPIMSQALPNLLHELLRYCGSLGLPAVRPEVRGLRMLWFLSFVASKLAIVPTWLRYNNVPDMHQPNLFSGKLSYLVCFALDLTFLRSAVRDLPRFLRPAGEMLPVVQAYKQPLRGAQAAASAAVASAVLGIVFGSYATGPLAVLLALAGLRSGSSWLLRLVAGALSSVVILDQLIPQPKECPESIRLLMPIFREVLKVFNYRIFPNGKEFLKDLPKDRHHLIATTPHGLFPWNAGAIVVSCIEAGYMPNLVGASVLGALPVAGRLLRCLGFHPADRKQILKCLKKEYPRNVTIILPGGIREMFQIREDIEISAANLHSGFADLAKQGGAMLVPAYGFGVSQLYKVARGPLAEFFARLSRKLQMSVALFTGRWGTLLPYPYEMACAMGEPIDTLKCADGKEAHRRYLQNLREAFETYKEAFGWADRDLYFEGEKMPEPPSDPLDEYTALPSSKL
eukprot:TRINITY_DN20150_c0_g1_i1.p1 TRINITY_DN20150_c0_g1~~TRINITY_DN20150_c0_g1_i1.p1  ORF type:complete len:699 (-),score=107.60 TRINITY_DN20150_c0_g1_i1:225-2252(-)